jgi:hypothetical protein
MSEPKRPAEKPIGDPPRPRTPYPVDAPVAPGGGANPDYLPGDTQQPGDLPER